LAGEKVHGGSRAAVAAAAARVVAWRMAYVGVLFLGCVFLVLCFFLPSAFSAQKAFLCFLFVFVAVCRCVVVRSMGLARTLLESFVHVSKVQRELLLV
jgi:hypothetical protein